MPAILLGAEGAKVSYYIYSFFPSGLIPWGGEYDRGIIFVLLHRCLSLKISAIVEVSMLRDESKTDRVNLVWSWGAVASSL